MNAVMFFTQTNWTGLWLKLNVKFDDVTVFPTGLMPALRNPTWWTSAILSWWDQVNYLALQFVVAGRIQIPAALSVDNAVRCDVTCCSAKWLAVHHTCPAALLSMLYLDEHAVCRMLMFDLMNIWCDVNLLTLRDGCGAMGICWEIIGLWFYIIAHSYTIT